MRSKTVFGNCGFQPFKYQEGESMNIGVFLYGLAFLSKAEKTLTPTLCYSTTNILKR